MLYREDFINRLSQKGYTKKDSAVILDDMLLTIREALVEGESVFLRGFGIFEVRQRAPKKVLPPGKTEKVTIPGYAVPTFIAGKQLKREVKEGFIRN